MNKEHTHVHISTDTIIRGILLILFFVFLYVLKDVIIIFLFAIIIASAVSPFASWLEKKGLPRLFGVLILYLLLFGLTVFILSLIVPYMADEISQLATPPPVIEDIKSIPRKVS